MKFTNNSLNIIYLCHAEKGPSGGAKIIYKHSDLINKLKKQFTSQVLHIKKKKSKKWSNSLSKVFRSKEPKYNGWSTKDITVKKDFKFNWFKNNIKVKNDFNFDKKKDFIIIPEIYAHFANDLCIKKKIPYAIFAQNGYCLNPTNDYQSLDKAYKNAKFVLSYGKDITKRVKSAFPFCSNKIQKSAYSLDKKDFNFSTKKINMITYMPREFPEHSSHLMFFLRNYLPKNWQIKTMHNLKEKEVYKYLLKSKIFLSFCQLKGLPLPPVEAAIAGNKVIGYTGEAGKEYWHEPVFTEIPVGNFSKFSFEILKSIKNKKKNKKFKSIREKLIKKFSPELEIFRMKIMLNKIYSFF